MPPRYANLEAYLDHLPLNADLVQHRPPDEEIAFWQGHINDCRQHLDGLLPVTEHRLETQLLRHLPFLWHVLTVIEAPIEGEVGANELQRRFNLPPQSSNQAPFIQVTAQNSNNRACAAACIACKEALRCVLRAAVYKSLPENRCGQKFPGSQLFCCTAGVSGVMCPIAVGCSAPPATYGRGSGGRGRGRGCALNRLLRTSAAAAAAL